MRIAKNEVLEQENRGKIHEEIENKKLEKAKSEFKFFFNNKVREDFAESTWENVKYEEEAQLTLKHLKRDLENFDKMYRELTGAYCGKTEAFEEEKSMVLKEVRKMINSADSHERN